MPVNKFDILKDSTVAKEFQSKFRYLLPNQLCSEFNIGIKDVNWLIKKLNLKTSDIIDTLTDKEIILMYENILSGKRKSFTNGVGKHKKYVKVIFRHLIFNILKWDRSDICNNFSSQILSNYRLDGFTLAFKLSAYGYIENFIPEYKIKEWELKSSSVGNGFWKKEENIKEALSWFKQELLSLGLNSIYDASRCGFRRLTKEYNFSGLCTVEFNGSEVKLFEKMFNCKYKKDTALKDHYTFDINEEIELTNRLQGVVYELNNSYYSLDKTGKRLIDEVIRFCEENKSFPSEKQMSNKNGYISRSQFYKYFNTKIFTDIYNYIYPLQKGTRNKDITSIQKQINKPKVLICSKCSVEKEFTKEYFSEHIAGKYGLKKMCRTCENKYVISLNYKRKGIIFENKEDINPIKWWEYFYQGKIYVLPNHCLKKENAIKILRYVIRKKMKLLSKEEICNGFKADGSFLINYRLRNLYDLFSSKLELLQECFPELNIQEYDLPKVPSSDSNLLHLIDNWVADNDMTVEDILNENFSLEHTGGRLKHLSYTRFNHMYEMLIWYLNRKNILHPHGKKDFTLNDFSRIRLVSAKDGCILDSYEEKILYEFLKFRLNLDIVATAEDRSNSNYLYYPNNGVDKYYRPDFIIAGVKDIVIEYYGLYTERETSHYKFYREKTHRKNKYYKSLDTVIFIQLYPVDLKDNFKGVIEKLKNENVIPEIQMPVH